MDLFAPTPPLPDGMTLLPARALDPAIWAAVQAILLAHPPRKMTTPHGVMSVGLTACGDCGWVADATGYRYADRDPVTGERWPPMPEVLACLARECAAEAGFPGFAPDTCLINDYAPGSRMGIHRDADEADFGWPIVSVSLGIPATFLVAGGRGAPDLRVPLQHGDVVVFGGPARRCRHGVARVPAARHGEVGARRINLTFRRAR
ncbi:MAG: oxidative demethylase AlkB [Pseudomonadota bacterium]|jgi:alkylated DNA repair protein (DNA oxidative demethylase)